MRFRDLTEEEILSLPLELFACHMIQGWNNGFQPETREEWAVGVGFHVIPVAGSINKTQRDSLAAIQAQKLHAYLSKYMDRNPY